MSNRVEKKACMVNGKLQNYQIICKRNTETDIRFRIFDTCANFIWSILGSLQQIRFTTQCVVNWKFLKTQPILRFATQCVANWGSKEILHAPLEKSDVLRRKSPITDYGVSDEFWKPGRLNPNLSWTHYRILLKVKLSAARSFYEIESAKNGWSARQLERQIDSLLFERLLKSRDKKGVLALSNKGLIINKPIDIIKDPIILEFLDFPESHRLVNQNSKRR